MGKKSGKTPKRPVKKPTNSDKSVHSVNSSVFIDKLKCYYTNADQLRNKLQELEVRIRDQQPHVIWITEVKPKNQTHQLNPAEFTLMTGSEYQMFTRNIEDKSGRGMILYIHKSLQATEVKMDTEFQENLFVKVKLNGKDELLIGIIYRSESGTEQNNSKLCEIITESVGLGFSHYLVMGDFNYPNID